MILSEFEEAVWHRRGSACDIVEAWHHGGEIVSAVEAVLEFGEVAGYMLVADGAVSASDGALDVAEVVLGTWRETKCTAAPWSPRKSFRRSRMSAVDRRYN